MDISITVQGRLDTTAITIDPSDLVETLKAQIHAKADVPIAVQLIRFQQGMFLAEDRLSLSHYGIQPGAILTVTIDPYRAEPMSICLDGSTDLVASVSVRRYDSVKSLKDTVETQFGIETSDQRLYFQGELLENEHTLAFYNVESKTQLLRRGDILVLVEREHAQKDYFVCTPKQTVASLKCRILTKYADSSLCYRLLLGTIELDESKTLEFYNIANNAEISLDHNISILVRRLESIYQYMETHYFDTAYELKEMIKRDCQEKFENFEVFHATELLKNDEKLGPIIDRHSSEFQIVLPNEVAFSLKNPYDNNQPIVANCTIPIREVLKCDILSRYKVKNLIFNGTVLEQFRTLTDYGVNSGAELEPILEITIRNVANSRISIPHIHFPLTIFTLKTIIEHTNHIAVANQRLIYKNYSDSYCLPEDNEIPSRNGLDMILLLPNDVVITIENSDKSTFKIAVSRNNTVKLLKRRIFEFRKIPILRQKLYIDNVKMENRRRIEHYELRADTNIALFDSEEILVKIQTSDEKITDFIITGDMTIKNLQRLLQNHNQFWFRFYSYNLTIMFAGKELLPTEKISKIGVKSGDILEVIVKSEIFVTIKHTNNEIKEMFIGSQTVKDIKNRFNNSDFVIEGRSGSVFFNKTELSSDAKLEDLNLGKKCQLDYMSPYEKMLIYQQTTNGDVFLTGLSETNIPAYYIKSFSRRRRIYAKKILYKGRQITPKTTLQSLHVAMWDVFDLILYDSLMLWVKPTTGKSVNIGVTPLDTIARLKEKITALIPISVEEMRIVYGSNGVLREDRTVSDYQISDGRTIEVLSMDDLILKIDTNVGKCISLATSKNTTWKEVKMKIERKTGWIRQRQMIMGIGGEVRELDTVEGLREGKSREIAIRLVIGS